MRLIRKAISIFDTHQKIHIAYIAVLIVISTFFELLGITAILPFISIIMEPDSMLDNKFVSRMIDILHISNTRSVLIALAIMLICVYLIKNVLLIYTNNAIFKFNYDSQGIMAKRILAAYLKQPYLFFVENNSANLIRNIKDDTMEFFDSMVAGMQLVAETLVVIVLFFYLMYKDKTITLVVGGTLVLFTYFIMRRIKTSVEVFGKNVRHSKGEVTKWLMQTFGGIKGTKLFEQTSFFLNNVEDGYSEYSVNQRKYQLYQYIPKPLVETVSILTLLAAIIIKLLMGVDPGYFVSTIAVFAVAAFRLIPSFNRITGYINRIAFGKASIDSIATTLSNIEGVDSNDNVQNKCVLQYNNSIELKGIRYKYPSGNREILNDVSISIPKNKSIGIIGSSGAGKTTLIDIVLGLLTPSEGNIFLDDIQIDTETAGWHKLFGYIPQNIYLLDDTIYNNVVYGRQDSLDYDKVKKALIDAQLWDYVEELEDGMDTVIGEQGIKLSGGQRQRIGIARALYDSPDILVLDEATSALDGETEKAIMDAINRFMGEKTMLIIAHRLTTIANCDIIYEVADGKVRLCEKV